MERQVQRRYVMQFNLTPKRKGRLTIPAVPVKVKGQTFNTNAVVIGVDTPVETQDFKLRMSALALELLRRRARDPHRDVVHRPRRRGVRVLDAGPRERRFRDRDPRGQDRPGEALLPHPRRRAGGHRGEGHGHARRAQLRDDQLQEGAHSEARGHACHPRDERPVRGGEREPARPRFLQRFLQRQFLRRAARGDEEVRRAVEHAQPRREGSPAGGEAREFRGARRRIPDLGERLAARRERRRPDHAQGHALAGPTISGTSISRRSPNQTELATYFKIPDERADGKIVGKIEGLHADDPREEREREGDPADRALVFRHEEGALRDGLDRRRFRSSSIRRRS